MSGGGGLEGSGGGCGVGPSGAREDGDNPEFSEHVSNAIFLSAK